MAALLANPPPASAGGPRGAGCCGAARCGGGAVCWDRRLDAHGTDSNCGTSPLTGWCPVRAATIAHLNLVAFEFRENAARIEDDSGRPGERARATPTSTSERRHPRPRRLGSPCRWLPWSRHRRHAWDRIGAASSRRWIWCAPARPSAGCRREVPDAEIHVARAQLDRLGGRGCRIAFALRPHEAGTADPVDDRQHDVARGRKADKNALGLALFGQQAQAVGQGVARRSRTARPSFDGYSSGEPLFQASHA